MKDHNRARRAQANRAIELLTLVQQVLQQGDVESTPAATEESEPTIGDHIREDLNSPVKDPDEGAPNAVLEYPNSPLRFKGWVH